MPVEILVIRNGSMYKRAGRFFQSLVVKSKSRTARRTRFPSTTRLAGRLDREVEKAGRASMMSDRAKPGLVKRQPPAEPSKEEH
jgi:hypothetical protein